MSVAPQLRNIDPEDEAQLLASIDRWVEKEVKPIAKEYGHANRYPDETVEQMKELGLELDRINVAARGVGVAEGALQFAIAMRPSCASAKAPTRCSA